MQWINVLEETRLPEGGREVVRVEGESIPLVRHQGQVYAVVARCPHMGAPLQNGLLADDGAIVCPWHRSAFDLRTGDVRDWTPWAPCGGSEHCPFSRSR